MDAFHPSGIIIRARPVTRKTNPLMNVILKKIQLCTCRGTETSTDDVLRCLTGRVDKLVGFGCISTGRSIYTNVDMQPKPTSLSICPVEQRNMSSIEVSVPLHVHSWIFFKDNVHEWVGFSCDGTGPDDDSRRTKRVRGWSRLNWLGGILIIVSLHIHFNKLLMPLCPYAALPIRCKVYNNRFTVNASFRVSLLFACRRLCQDQAT